MRKQMQGCARRKAARHVGADEMAKAGAGWLRCTEGKAGMARQRQGSLNGRKAGQGRAGLTTTWADEQADDDDEGPGRAEGKAGWLAQGPGLGPGDIKKKKKKKISWQQKKVKKK